MEGGKKKKITSKSTSHFEENLPIPGGQTLFFFLKIKVFFLEIPENH